MKTKRLQIDISEDSFTRLKDLKKKSDSSSYGDVTSKAYKLYEFLLNAERDNKKIMMTDANGNQVEVKLI